MLAAKASLVLCLVAAMSGGSNTAEAQTVNVCQNVVRTISHPAETVVDVVNKFNKKNLSRLECLAHAICCAPGDLWKTDPFCYDIQVEHIPRVIKEAWDEKVAGRDCHDMSPADAAKVVLGSFYTPLDGLGLSSAVPILQFLAQLTGSALAVARPLPAELKEQLKKAVGAAGKRYSKADVDAARWLRYDEPAAVPLWATVQVRDPGAVTFKELIIAGPSLLAEQNGCHRMATWGHEVVHIHQYREVGFNGFMDRYLSESPQGYCNISYEKEGYATEAALRVSCGEAEVTCQ